MKTRNVILIIATGLLMSGCFIKSLYPFYTKKDIVYDPKIIGTWTDEDSSKWIIKQQMKWPIAPDSSYQVEIVEKDGSMGSFNVHLFRLNNQLYLDFYPSGKIGSNDIVEENIVLIHSLAKITYSKDVIKIQWFNEVWLEKLLDQNKIRIRHEKIYENDLDINSYLLTASTEELQKFIIKYGNDPQAFKSIWEGNQEDREKEALTFNLKKVSNDAN
jgi:hypothetical protein